MPFNLFIYDDAWANIFLGLSSKQLLLAWRISNLFSVDNKDAVLIATMPCIEHLLETLEYMFRVNQIPRIIRSRPLGLGQPPLLMLLDGQVAQVYGFYESIISYEPY